MEEQVAEFETLTCSMTEAAKNLEEDRSKSLKDCGANLPRLTIRKFKGSHLDWLRFWSQFETEIDKASITQVAKFSYLINELLIPKVRALVDVPPYNEHTHTMYHRFTNRTQITPSTRYTSSIRSWPPMFKCWK